MVKIKTTKQFKRFKTSYMNDASNPRRVECASILLEKFEKNLRMIERTVFQDEIDFRLQIQINSQNDRV